MIRPMPDDQRPDDAPSLEAPSLGRLFGRRKGRAADEPGTDQPGTDQQAPDTAADADDDESVIRELVQQLAEDPVGVKGRLMRQRKR